MPEDSARVFFALWPEAPVREALHALSGRLHALRGGRRTRPETLHLTLLFIGAIARVRIPELCAAASSVQLPRFTIHLDRAGCWRHNRIAHVGASVPPAELLDLVAGLEAAVAARGIAFDRRPYTAHVTLLRHADCRAPEPVIEAIAWPVREFVLVESRLQAAGPHYEILGRWPLLAAQA